MGKGGILDDTPKGDCIAKLTIHSISLLRQEEIFWDTDERGLSGYLNQLVYRCLRAFNRVQTSSFSLEK